MFSDGGLSRPALPRTSPFTTHSSQLARRQPPRLSAQRPVDGRVALGPTGRREAVASAGRRLAAPTTGSVTAGEFNIASQSHQRTHAYHSAFQASHRVHLRTKSASSGTSSLSGGADAGLSRPLGAVHSGRSQMRWTGSVATVD
ncbi:hypothetical protein GY45DRAFT_1119970 [Cubamyces sp. BRFM 1775]|nr:hypothetical protein GY45DRAFT_1119970 [Cubamyces sp. BRFM 1775]